MPSDARARSRCTAIWASFGQSSCGRSSRKAARAAPASATARPAPLRARRNQPKVLARPSSFSADGRLPLVRYSWPSISRTPASSGCSCSTCFNSAMARWVSPCRLILAFSMRCCGEGCSQALMASRQSRRLIRAQGQPRAACPRTPRRGVIHRHESAHFVGHLRCERDAAMNVELGHARRRRAITIAIKAGPVANRSRLAGSGIGSGGASASRSIGGGSTAEPACRGRVLRDHDHLIERPSRG